jgi:hypothetical protein
MEKEIRGWDYLERERDKRAEEAFADYFCRLRDYIKTLYELPPGFVKSNTKKG